jgi:potassium efflux system protein
MRIRTLILSALLITLLLPLAAQDQQRNSADTITVPEIQPINITDIPEEFDALNLEVSGTWPIINDTVGSSELTTMLPIAQVYLDSVKAIFEDQKEQLTYRSLEAFRLEWSNYATRLQTWKKSVSSRLNKLDKKIQEVELTMGRWSVTKTSLGATEGSEQLLTYIGSALDTLKFIDDALLDRANLNLKLLNDIAEKTAIVNNFLGEIKRMQVDIQAAYFFRDSNPIWKKLSRAAPEGNIFTHIARLFNNNARQIRVFLNNNLSSLYLHLAIFILAIIAFLVIRRRIISHKLISEDTEINQAKSLLIRPLALAIFMSLIAGLLIYENRPVILTEATYLIILLPLFFLLPRIIPANLKPFMVIIIFMFLCYELQIFLDPLSLIRRIVLLVATVLAIWFFVSIRRFNQRNRELVRTSRWHLLVSTARFFIVLLVISFIGNILGYVVLSDYLTNSVIGAVLVTIVFFMFFMILKAITIYGLRLFKKDYWYNEIRINLQNRILRVVSIAIWIIWGITILRIFNLFRFLLEWMENIMGIEWSIGENVTISLGGIISFIIIVVVTFVLANWIKKLFKSEFILRSKIPRGVPAAISMLTRYIIVAFGVYIALVAAGVDLGQFGLIAGALGVGIGFGLQNVVYNFISGLIISFERPIHVGDTIEVGTLMGNVTEIGVRSSKVKTFDGSEVIVPNGNLISNEVINWTLSDQKRRLKIIIRTDYNADPNLVLKIIREEAEKYTNTLKEPPVMALFDGYGDSSLDFTLYFWVYFNVGFTSKSEVALNIYQALKTEGIGVPLPIRRWQQDSGDKPLKS